ncbi:site-specific integrase [Thioclava electrotropha]|uniref:Tyrosine-type recombinase/integrase n=1 Tax=Thioclava electrotropha TaxID=1549850 RepID=A0ABX6YZ20_9RHOB|nr:tyrosine-type recombinase/integrase [Thioclava electrotropha]QPZ92519.1 tyrosine-type recombinase/integrase [Thioclava electrotropha]
MTRRALPKYVYEDREYVRFIRRARGQSEMMHEEPGSPEFWDHYNRLLKAEKSAPSNRNFEALILSYYESEAFQKLAPRTKSDYHKYISHIRDIWGDYEPAKIETTHIYELQQANRHHWRQANYLVQVMVVLLNHARLKGFIKGTGDKTAAHGVPLLKQKSDGWEPWPQDVREEFEEVATARARLVYELCIGTGQRIGDVVKIRWGDLSEGVYRVKQGKTDKELWIPLTERLAEYLSAVPKKGLHVITDAKGRPVSYRMIAEEMRKVKASMKHPQAKKYVTHGLRKNATIELYLAGCDDEMVKAVTGHSGVEMLKKYGGEVRQRLFAQQAQEARNRMEQNKKGT